MRDGIDEPAVRLVQRACRGRIALAERLEVVTPDAGRPGDDLHDARSCSLHDDGPCSGWRWFCARMSPSPTSQSPNRFSRTVPVDGGVSRSITPSDPLMSE